MLPQQQVKNPAKSAGGRLQLNMHAPYVCGLAWRDMTEHTKTDMMGHTEMAAVSHGTSHVAIKQHCKYTTLVDIQKHAIKS